MILDSVEQLMRLAIERAREGIDCGQTPFGAAIAKRLGDGRFELVSCEHNRVWVDTDITAHAEIVAIRKACSGTCDIKLIGCVIATTTEPCPMCFSAIHWAGIEEIFFGASISDAQDAGFSELTISNDRMRDEGNSPLKITSGILEDECRQLFDLFRKNRGRTY